MNQVLGSHMQYPYMALFLILKDKKRNQNVLVANTHLIFQPRKGNLKLGMLVLTLKTVTRILNVFTISDFFFCGDFNIIPNSMLYQYLATGDIDLDASLEEYSNQIHMLEVQNSGNAQETVATGDKKFVRRNQVEDELKLIDPAFLRALTQIQVELPEKNGDSYEIRVIENVSSMFTNQSPKKSLEVLSRGLLLKSTYADFKNTFWKIQGKNKTKIRNLHFYWSPDLYNNDALVTQFAPDLKNTVDYIWYSGAGNYKPFAIWELPNPILLHTDDHSMPNKECGSDHFPLVADFIYQMKG